MYIYIHTYIRTEGDLQTAKEPRDDQQDHPDHQASNVATTNTRRPPPRDPEPFERGEVLVLLESEDTQKTQYSLTKEYTLNHNIKAPVILRYIP